MATYGYNSSVSDGAVDTGTLTPQMQIALNDADKLMDELIASLQGLELRLTDILTPDSSVKAPSDVVLGSPIISHSNHVLHVYSVIENIKRCLGTVHKILSRLEV